MNPYAEVLSAILLKIFVILRLYHLEQLYAVITILSRGKFKYSLFLTTSHWIIRTIKSESEPFSASDSIMWQACLKPAENSNAGKLLFAILV